MGRLLLYRARYYSPQIRRFISAPTGVLGGTTFIDMADRPTQFKDPLGLWVVGFGVSYSGQLGPIAGQGSAGVLIDSNGGIGTYVSGGLGAGVGLQTSMGVSVFGSNAPYVGDMGGPLSTRVWAQGLELLEVSILSWETVRWSSVWSGCNSRRGSGRQCCRNCYRYKCNANSGPEGYQGRQVVAGELDQGLRGVEIHLEVRYPPWQAANPLLPTPPIFGPPRAPF